MREYKIAGSVFYEKEDVRQDKSRLLEQMKNLIIENQELRQKNQTQAENIQQLQEELGQRAPQIKNCINCKHVGVDPASEPCYSCGHNARDRWETQ